MMFGLTFRRSLCSRDFHLCPLRYDDPSAMRKSRLRKRKRRPVDRRHPAMAKVWGATLHSLSPSQLCFGRLTGSGSLHLVQHTHTHSTHMIGGNILLYFKFLETKMESPHSSFTSVAEVQMYEQSIQWSHTLVIHITIAICWIQSYTSQLLQYLEI